MHLIPNAWKHKIRKETSQKSLFKILYFNNKCITKINDLQKFSNKDTYFTLQYMNTKHIKPFHGQTLQKDTKISALIF